MKTWNVWNIWCQEIESARAYPSGKNLTARTFHMTDLRSTFETLVVYFVL